MRTKGRSDGLILGIESSCDETAAAVVRAGGEVLANVVASQIALHAKYGGVVPELASREHLRNIVPVVTAAMAEAGVGFGDLDAIAVTEGPGLAGALLVGITYAKALALALEKPLIAVNHLEGHIHAVLMGVNHEREGNTSHLSDDGAVAKMGHPVSGQGMELPLMALVVSGGHTHLYLCEFVVAPTRDDETVTNGPPIEVAGTWRYRNVGRTVDDAAGEAFDKVAKLLGLGYPGGPWMDALAKEGNPRAVEFKFGQIKTRRVRTNNGNDEDKSRFPSGMTNKEEGTVPTFDFSFSGIKTAVLRYIQTHGMAAGVEARRRALADALKANPAMRAAEALKEMPEVFDAQTLDLIASFQYAVVGNLMRQTFAAAEALGARGIVVSGGVSANSELRRRFAEEAARRGLRVAFPTMAMATDNAAMIAAAAWGKLCAGEFAAEGLVATPGLKLG
ncbi:MAG TPA: tRNA (adenosine(37)-N6)-threonylcarbamoyltransferase complex transferase subunit TsaD [Acidobacteriaceae bacterium]|jgi:N6-L-threonylcarbamoyladenine synthase|nr:tRNA (adenosine(37)-N6)-threonylcarbamoyltransferase complex transferase subunit TsaD [Acidobacteriaceae bacterium]